MGPGKRTIRNLRRRSIPAEHEKKPNLIPGFHAVKEALVKDSFQIKELWISKGKNSSKTRELIRLALSKNIPVHYKERRTLDRQIHDTAHQGLLAFIEKFEYLTLDNLISTSVRESKNPILIAADHITDEGNLGALIRSAAFFGSQGLILPKDRSAAISGRVMKRSSGAYMHLPIARVVNMGRALDILTKKDFWIIGAAGKGSETIYSFDWDRPMVLIMGNEEKGLSVSVEKRCHQLVKIPGTGKVESLNVAVACGIILSEITRQRKDLINS